MLDEVCNDVLADGTSHMMLKTQGEGEPKSNIQLGQSSRPANASAYAT